MFKDQAEEAVNFYVSILPKFEEHVAEQKDFHAVKERAVTGIVE